MENMCELYMCNADHISCWCMYRQPIQVYGVADRCGGQREADIQLFSG